MRRISQAILARLILATAIAVLGAGCDRSPQKTPSASLPAHVSGDGVIRGSVLFGGDTPPTPKPVAVNDRNCGGDQPIVEQSVVVNSNGTLRNAFVYLENAPETDGSILPAALLDQVHCQYEPHAMGVQVAQPLQIRSSDPTIHNVHIQARKNRSQNLSMTTKGQETQTSFQYPEFIRVKCDVHPWMTAWVGVFQNPFFAVTGDDGSFQITGVPAGNYTLVAWHEIYGRQQRPIIIRADDKSSTRVQFSFGAAQ